MDVKVIIGGPDQMEELASLEDWLLNEPDLAGSAITRPATTPEPGHMGAISDVLMVALGSGGMGVALARSLSVWLSSRPSGVSARVRTPRGEIEIKARDAADLRAVVEAVTPLVSGSDTTPS